MSRAWSGKNEVCPLDNATHHSDLHATSTLTTSRSRWQHSQEEPRHPLHTNYCRLHRSRELDGPKSWTVSIGYEFWTIMDMGLAIEITFIRVLKYFLFLKNKSSLPRESL